VAAQDGPQFLWTGGGDFFRRVFVAPAALEEVEAAAGIGGRLEDGNLLVAVFSKRIDFGEQVACLAGCHVADEEP
jgi:hypothetical protein